MLFQGNSIKNSTFKEPCGEGVFSFQTKLKLFYHRRVTSNLFSNNVQNNIRCNFFSFFKQFT